MSDLQIILIVIGALIIFAVIIVNWWQERRFHQQVENSFSTLKSDALLDDPALDTTDLYDAKEEPTFDELAYENALSEEKFSVEALTDDTTPEEQFISATQNYTFGDDVSKDVAIDDTYSQLIDEKNNPRYQPQIDNDLDPVVEPRSAQHDDIKAIFNEAFNHKSLSISNGQDDGEVASGSVDEAPAHEAAKDVIAALHEPEASLPAMLDGQMDLTALLYLANETKVSQLAGALVGLLDGYDKPVFVHILDTNQKWHLLKEVTPSQLATRVACSMQLADRAGPVSRNALNRFQLAVETAGLDINAHVEWQSNDDAMTAATALDTFCIEVDKTIGFHLTHGENGAFTGTKLRGLAESQGLTLTSDGVFKSFDEATDKPKPQAAFVMFNRDDHPFSPDMLRTSVVKGVTFQLDIPHVKHCAEAFSQMVQVARQMEIGLNAVLVDDNNKVLGDMQIEKIRQQLKVIHATMLVRGIVPGTDSAHRLFS
ncbi:MAG TPA: cell division protein ZipA C-terminal FtsZ-binding domain-containing protein [Methylotenera sp.]|nr:cell division protein ZipA C-terminal FtsZ-binding domain-containing protein [Methylotenera sp.]